MTHSKCLVKGSSHTFRICLTVSKVGKEEIWHEALAEVAVLLKPLCVLGSENSINRMSDNRVHQCPGEHASRNPLTCVLRDHPVRPSSVVNNSGIWIYISWLIKTKESTSALLSKLWGLSIYIRFLNNMFVPFFLLSFLTFPNEKD